MSSKKTVILGASTNPSRYSYMAANRLTEHGHEIVPVGIKKGDVAEVQIQNDKTLHENVDTVTLYLGPQNQPEYYDFILKLKPKRVIFNPGTYNEELIKKLKENKIEVVDACTLVMLSADTY
jgi:predicted CoA-binding protein